MCTFPVQPICTFSCTAHLTPYFISLFVSYLILTIFVYIYTLSCFLFHSFLLLLCYFFYFIIMFYFSFLHFPLSGPVPTNISLPIIPCMIVYVTNNKEPWTLNLELVERRLIYNIVLIRISFSYWRSVSKIHRLVLELFCFDLICDSETVPRSESRHIVMSFPEGLAP